MLGDIHGWEFQLLICTHLGEQFEVKIYSLLADPKM
jgi:hypothetical protein